jgi:hypothetical protein
LNLRDPGERAIASGPAVQRESAPNGEMIRLLDWGLAPITGYMLPP